MAYRPVGVFDSGVGGLAVLTRCMAVLPRESFIYLADEANMPYGQKDPEEIRRAACDCACFLASMNCKAIVVACNTATENAIGDIRALFPALPVIGLEPAIKPCIRDLDGGYALALVTPATYRSEKFLSLISGREDMIKTEARAELAPLIDRGENNETLRKTVFDILSRYRDARAVVLGCSHYSFLSGMISEFYGGNIRIYDGAAGEAARLKYVLCRRGLLNPAGGGVRFYSTVKKI